MAAATGVPARPQGLWRFAALAAVYFGFIGYFNPYLPLWLKELGFGSLAIGGLTAVQSLTRVIAPYSWGWLSDHTGRRTLLMRWAASLGLASSLGLLWMPQWVPPSVSLVAVVLFLMFFNTSAMMPMAEAALAQRVSTSQGLDLARYGQVRVWGSVGFIVTVLVFGCVFERFGLAWFATGTVALLAALVAVCWRLPAGDEASTAGSPAPALAPVLALPAVRWFFVSVFFMILAHVALYAFFSLYLDALGHSKRVVGMLWAVSVMVEIVWFLLQGRWLVRWPLSYWMVLVCGVAALRFGATAAFGTSLVVLVVAQLSHALTFATHHTVCMAFIHRHFGDRLRGRGQALYSVLGYGVPGVLGGVVGGALGDAWGWSSVFWAAALAAGLATLAAWRVAQIEG
ncbi:MULTISPECIES: MFS transporter [Caldimonas]|uniref:MFS transporter n=1 Tax=Caldimonas TaxID=196013 RepID=UPI00036DD7A9|nr:MFS transporter [Caldimonas manganoxidans]